MVRASADAFSSVMHASHCVCLWTNRDVRVNFLIRIFQPAGFMLGCGNLGTVSASFRVSPFRDYELEDIPDFDMS